MFSVTCSRTRARDTVGRHIGAHPKIEFMNFNIKGVHDHASVPKLSVEEKLPSCERAQSRIARPIR